MFFDRLTTKQEGRRVVAASLYRGRMQYVSAEAAFRVLMEFRLRPRGPPVAVFGHAEVKRGPSDQHDPVTAIIPLRASNCQIGPHGLAFSVPKGIH
jgi:hypothetical protein